MNRLRLLTKQLQSPANAGGSVSESVISALHTAMAADNEKAIKVLEDKLAAANKVCDELRKECAKAKDKCEAAIRNGMSETQRARDAARAELNKQAEAHAKVIAIMESKLSQATKECQDEHRLRVKAESDCAAECKMREKFEKMVTAQQSAKDKPVQVPEVRAIMPPAQPMTMIVSQRDQSGRIVAVSITPTK